MGGRTAINYNKSPHPQSSSFANIRPKNRGLLVIWITIVVLGVLQAHYGVTCRDCSVMGNHAASDAERSEGVRGSRASLVADINGGQFEDLVNQGCDQQPAGSVYSSGEVEMEVLQAVGLVVVAHTAAE